MYAYIYGPSIKKLPFILLIAALVLSPFSVQRALAAGEVGDGTPGSCTEATLVAALTGGGLVTFNCGGAVTIVLTSTKTISSDTTIQGGNMITLSGGNSTRIFLVNSGVTLTLQDITIANGNDNDAGGILNNGGTLNILHSTFTGNTADCTGAGTCYANGGAIKNQNIGVLNITDSSFINNSGGPEPYEARGGAIYNADSTLNITHSLFSGNTSQEGGAIYNYSGTIQVTGVSTFTENIATKAGDPSGGAIYNWDRLTVSQTTFSENHASSTSGGDAYGGAICSRYRLTVTDSNFTDNYAASGGGHGGAIWISSQSTITGSDFSGNYTDGNSSGGTIYYYQGAHIVDNSTFTGRTGGLQSANEGGAISNLESTLTITNSDFIENYAGAGGGVYVRSPGTLSISESTFDSNQASDGGGGLFNSSTIVNITGSIFRENEAVNTGDALGGGIYNGGTMTVTLTTFEANAATSTSAGNAKGGGIYSLYSTLTIQDSAFFSNTVDTASTTSVIGNGGSELGSAIHAGGTMTITSSAFYHNDAHEGNGTVYLDSGDYVVGNTTFYSNTVGTEGSAIEKTTLAKIFLNNSTIANNGGIALSWDSWSQHPITMTNTIVSNNASNCQVGITDGGGNIQYGVGSSCGGGTIPNVDPMLDMLADYGGPTLTMRLQVGSPAINNAAANCPVLDQRGFTRSVAPCDSGAYEVGGSGVTLTSSSNPSTPWQTVTFTATVEKGEASTPTGTITFKEGAVVLDTVAVDGSGQATYTTTWREIGDHTITAEYSGINYNPSVSPELVQEVEGYAYFYPWVCRN